MVYLLCPLFLGCPLFICFKLKPSLSAPYKADQPNLCAHPGLLSCTSSGVPLHGSVDTNKPDQYMDFPSLVKNSSDDELPDFRFLCRIAGTFPGQSPCACPPWPSIPATAGNQDMILLKCKFGFLPHCGNNSYLPPIF